MINSILTNVKYVGTLAYNRRSGKLANPRQHNDASTWIVKGGAVPQLLPSALFNRAQIERAKRNRRYPHGELLGLLRSCHAKHGQVTASVIAADPMLPDPQLFKRAFGSLTAAYDQAGLPQTRQHTFVSTKRLLLELQRTLFSEVCALAAAAGATDAVLHAPHTLLLNGSVMTRVVVAPRRKPVRGFANWAVKPKRGVHFTIAARYNPDVQDMLDYFLLPSEVFDGRPIYLKALNNVTIAESRYEKVEHMFAASVTEDTKIRWGAMWRNHCLAGTLAQLEPTAISTAFGGMPTRLQADCQPVASKHGFTPTRYLWLIKFRNCTEQVVHPRRE
jgi:hypothetical protein